ncbi:hypothetical protein FJW03_16310 [Mesorhizobium sp. B4-1-4]|nr:hypothetical protein [Mesorhizobium sp. B4-1-4]UCI29421.1 hypothetical protein FJW03_16310 [Mesorhizobium sp. B4-1-4]
MVDRENREDWRRELSLLALGQAIRGEDGKDASLVSIGDRADPAWREDAATRHRLARSRREARTDPTLPAVETERLRPDGQPGATAQHDDLVSMRQLEREAAAKRSVYEHFLLRAEETGEQKDINTANMNVISKGFAPLEAKGPLRAGMAHAGRLLGFASGVGRALMARLRNALSRKPSDEADDGISSALATFGENARGADAAMPSGHPNPDSVFMPRPVVSDYPRPFFHPGFDTTYSRPMGPPSRSPLLPLQSVYPAPPPYPNAQQAGYPQMQPWQAPSPASYPYTQAVAPYAGHIPYPPQPPASPQPSAYPVQPPVEPSQVEEGAEQAPIDEIRASLREFREAVRELAESRARRRYF